MGRGTFCRGREGGTLTTNQRARPPPGGRSKKKGGTIMDVDELRELKAQAEFAALMGDDVADLEDEIAEREFAFDQGW